MNEAPWIKRAAGKNPVLVSLTVLAVLVAAVGTLGNAAGWIRQTIDDHIRWRNAETETISSLQSGVTMMRFDELLGAPMFMNQLSNQAHREVLYQRRGYWVQAIISELDVVEFFSVTVCDERFRPTLTLRTGDQVTLNLDVLANMPESPSPEVLYESSMLGGNRFLEFHGGGNPTDYRRMVIGLVDTCPGSTLGEFIWEEPYAEFLDTHNAQYHGPLRDDLHDVRQRSTVNTYGEWAPLVDPDGFEFDVGPSRHLVRQAGDP